ncbi:MAG: hypothetical protein J6X30_03920 [Clostridia bacterium]|nr:hypothetical protein [Clostridia bacterium]
MHLLSIFVLLAQNTIEFTSEEVLRSLLLTIAVFALAALGRFLLRLIRRKKKKRE